MNWQCDNKQFYGVGSDSAAYENAKTLLKEARTARQTQQKTNNKWICHVAHHVSDTKVAFLKNFGRPVLNALSRMGANTQGGLLVLSQVVLETSWGTKVFGNNLFNIKGSHNGHSISFTTHEQMQDGHWIKTEAAFREYLSVEDAVKDYVQILKNKWPKAYNAIFSTEENAVQNFTAGLHAGQPGGYATDKRYAKKIILIHKQIGELFSASSSFPTYLRCLGREQELQNILEASHE